MTNKYDSIYILSCIKVIEEGGFSTTVGVMNGLLAILSNSETDNAIGLYGNEVKVVEIVSGEDRFEIIDNFISEKEESELSSIWGADKDSSFYRELFVGALNSEFDDFEYETDKSVYVADAENEVDFDNFIGCLGLSIGHMDGGEIQFIVENKSLVLNGESVADLGELFDKLQCDGEFKTAVVD